MSANPEILDNPIAAAAIQYAQQGQSVIPVSRDTKKPLLPAWRDYQDKPASIEQVRQWFTRDYRGANVALITGVVSGVSVVDCDSEEAIALATAKGIGQGPSVRTGRGQHFYFQGSAARNFQKRDDLPGIDFRGHGGYVVAPPSIHASGRRYEWVNKDAALEPLPEWVLPAAAPVAAPRRDLVQLAAPARQGERNNRLVQLAGTLAARGIELEAAIELALGWNARSCIPPDGESSVVSTVRSVYAAEARNHPDRHPEAPLPLRILRAADLRERLMKLYDEGRRPGVATGWRSLDRHYTVRKGEVTLFTGIPSHGKTTFLDALITNLAKREEWRFLFLSPENLPEERHLAGLTEKFVGRPFGVGPSARMSKEQLAQSMVLMEACFSWIDSHGAVLSVNAILEAAAAEAERDRLDVLVLDPWNELDHQRAANLTETEYISDALSRIRRFARLHHIAVFLVAHPTKLQRDKNGEYPVPTPYDISGSAHWRNKADNCITVWRDLRDDETPVQIHVQKIRFREVGHIGLVELRFDKLTGRYSEIEEA
jgi:hypothetical protein